MPNYKNISSTFWKWWYVRTFDWISMLTQSYKQNFFFLLKTQTMFSKIHISKWHLSKEKSNLWNWFFSVFDSTFGLSHSEDKHWADICPTGQEEAPIKAIVYLAVIPCHMADRNWSFKGPTPLVFTFKTATWSQHVPPKCWSILST